MEIEKRFAITSDAWRAEAQAPVRLAQYYLHEAEASRLYLWMHKTEPDGARLTMQHMTGARAEFTVPQAALDKLGDEGWNAIVGEDGVVVLDRKHTGRVRMVGEDEAVITIKADTHAIDSRHELEFDIPRDAAEALLMNDFTSCGVEKDRYKIPVAGTELKWEVDVFRGKNEGLIMAEIELPASDTPFTKPDWVGVELSADRRYSNRALAEHPYQSWGEVQKALPTGGGELAR